MYGELDIFENFDDQFDHDGSIDDDIPDSIALAYLEERLIGNEEIPFGDNKNVN